jgi:hypothetical protein
LPERRVFRPRTRRSGHRDASLIVIASEGQNPERQYFEDLVSPENYPNPRVYLEVIERDPGPSSPSHVLESLNKFRREYGLSAEDELWIVIDRDRWTPRELSTVCTQCRQKGYRTAVSNPCFELWLLLHVKQMDEYSPEEILQLEQNLRQPNNRTRIEEELRRSLGSYRKNNIESSRILTGLPVAIAQARSLDVDPDNRWPNRLGTHVYRLVERVLPPGIFR